jgi:hypothetical protein
MVQGKRGAGVGAERSSFSTPLLQAVSLFPAVWLPATPALATVSILQPDFMNCPASSYSYDDLRLFFFRQ